MLTKARTMFNTVTLFAAFALIGGLAHAAQFEGDTTARSERQLAPFAAELIRWSHADASKPDDLETMVGSTSLTLVGRLIAVKPGRKAVAGYGCDDADEESGHCNGAGDSIIYDSYANLIVEPQSVLRGKLSVPGRPVHVEIPWPNNLDVGALERTLPGGARIIVMGEPVRGADEAAAPLVARGLMKRNEVADNLVSVPPYGFIMESAGGVLAPMWGEGALVQSYEAAAAFESFDNAVEALEAAAPNAIEPEDPGPLPRTGPIMSVD